MRKIEEKVIKTMWNFLDGKVACGKYTLSKRDRVEFQDNVVRYFLWNSNIFKVEKWRGRLRLEFSDNGYATQTTYSRLKALVNAFILPGDSLYIRKGFLYIKNSHDTSQFCDLSIENIFEVEE